MRRRTKAHTHVVMEIDVEGKLMVMWTIQMEIFDVENLINCKWNSVILPDIKIVYGKYVKNMCM